MKFFRIVAALGLFILWSLPFAAHAVAPITISEVHVYENIFQTGDAVFVVYYQLDSGTWSSQLGVAQLYTPGGVVLQERSFNASDGLYYLTGFIFGPLSSGGAGDPNDLNGATAGNGWGSAMEVKLSGNPTQFTTVPTVNRTLVAADWHTSTDMANGASQIQNRMVSLLNQIEADDPTIADGDLVANTPTGWRATTAGAEIVLNAIPGLYTPVPNLFITQSSTATFDQTTPGTGLQTSIDAATASGPRSYSDAFGQAFGFGNFFSILLGIAAVVLVFILARKQSVPAMASLGLAVPTAIFAARLGILPLGYLALSIFISWFVGMWRAVRPSFDTMIVFVATMYIVGILLGALMDGANVSGGALSVLNSMFSMRIFSQQDSSILGSIFSIVIAPFELVMGLVRMAFWNFAFWNNLGIVKWIFWMPIAFAFYFKLYTVIFGRGK